MSDELMRAAVYHAQRDIRIEDRPIPELGEGELLLQVVGVGICGTDAAEFSHGPSMFPIGQAHPVTGHGGPMVPGHEFAGVVAGVGSGVNGFSEGDLVAAGAGISCGECARCRAGRTNLCDRYATVGLQRDGGLAEFVTTPARCVLNVERRALTGDTAALSQPMSIAVHAMRRGRPEPGEPVTVIGVGGIGAFLVHALVQHGCAVTAVDLDVTRLAVASRLGADRTIAASIDTPLVDQLSDTGIEPAISYECTGTAVGVEAAVNSVGRGGRVVVVGLHKAPVAVDLTSVALQEKELVGTLAHVFDADFAHAVDLIEEGIDHWSAVAPTVLPLEDLVEGGIEPMITGDDAAIKALLDPRISNERPIDVGPARQQGERHGNENPGVTRNAEPYLTRTI